MFDQYREILLNSPTPESIYVRLHDLRGWCKDNSDVRPEVAAFLSETPESLDEAIVFLRRDHPPCFFTGDQGQLLAFA